MDVMFGARVPGEFEKQQAVAIFWPKVKEPIKGYDAFKVYARLIKEMVKEAEVYVNCGIDGLLEQCKAALAEEDVDTEHIHFSQFPDLTSWARDYGPEIIENENKEMRHVSFRFNLYGESEEDFPMAVRCARMGTHMAVETGCRDIVFSSLFSEGGDREHNGQGIMMAISDTEVRKRNPDKTLEEVEEEYRRVFNVKKFIWLPLGTYDDESIFEGVLDKVNGENIYRSASANGHIDEMCRFADANTIILAEVTEKEAGELESARITRERLEQAYEILKNETDMDGKPFKILRMPVPEPVYLESVPGDWSNSNYGSLYSDDTESLLRDGTKIPTGTFKIQPAMSYCNFLILNGVVLGQKYWHEGMPLSIKEKDEAAEKVLKEAFPGRRVVMLETMAVNVRGGGIHCITKNIPAMK